MGKCIRTLPMTVPTYRHEPYPSPHNDKENINPNASKSKSKSKAPPKQQKKTAAPKPCDDPHQDWRDIELEEIWGEVPCYDSASIVRRKLNNLVNSKGDIPYTWDGWKKEKWSKASMSREMMKLQEIDGPLENDGRRPGGSGDPTASSLGTFLKKTGEMGGGGSPCYYWGYVLLEKLRIYHGEKKTKSREAAEEKFPSGHARWDPDTAKGFIFSSNAPMNLITSRPPPFYFAKWS